MTKGITEFDGLTVTVKIARVTETAPMHERGEVEIARLGSDDIGSRERKIEAHLS